MPVKSDNGIPVVNNTQTNFKGYSEIIITDATTISLSFNFTTNKTTVSWNRGIDHQDTEKYDIYRRPYYTNETGAHPLLNKETTVGFDNDPIDDPEDYDIEDSKIILDAQKTNRININPLSYPTSSIDFSVPSGTEGWFFYALVIISTDGNRKVVVPDFGVWESNHGLAAPTSLIAVSGYKKVDLFWTAAAGAAGYRVFYDDESGTDINSSSLVKLPQNFDLVGSPNYGTYITGTTYSVENLSIDPVKNYYFRVRSVSSGGVDGPFSNEVEQSPIGDIDTPPRIEAYEIVATNLAIGNTVEVSWDAYVAPSDIKEYLIYYSTVLFDDASQATYFNKTTEKSIEVNILTDGTIYYFAVVVVDIAGNKHTTLLNVTFATPTAATQVTYSDTVPFYIENVIESLGISKIHVIFGEIQVPIEATGSIDLSKFYVYVTVRLSSAGNISETLQTQSDSTGFWSINLGNLTESNWEDGDIITIEAKDFTTNYIANVSSIINENAGAQREDFLLEDTSLRSPVLLEPITGGTSQYPVFKLYSVSQDQNLKFKIELSGDNFRTILKVFDETQISTGWSRSTELVGGVEMYTAVYRSFQEDRLVDGEIYQWRAYANNGVRFSSPSFVSQFSVALEQLDKASDIWSFTINAPSLIEMYKIVTDTGDYTYSGVTITDSTPIFEWKMTGQIPSNNIHFRLEMSSDDPTFSNPIIYESKDNPLGFEYTEDGVNWIPFTRAGVSPGVMLYRYVVTKNIDVL